MVKVTRPAQRSNMADRAGPSSAFASVKQTYSSSALPHRGGPATSSRLARPRNIAVKVSNPHSNGDVWRALFAVGLLDESLALLGTNLTTSDVLANANRDPSDDAAGQAVFHLSGVTSARLQAARAAADTLRELLAVVAREGALFAEDQRLLASSLLEELRCVLQGCIPWRCTTVPWTSTVHVTATIRALEALQRLKQAHAFATRVALFTANHEHNPSRTDVAVAAAAVLFPSAALDVHAVFSSAPQAYIPDRVILSFSAQLELSLVVAGGGWTADAAAATSRTKKKFHIGAVEFVSLGSDRQRLLQLVVDRVASDGLPQYLTFLQRFDAQPAVTVGGSARQEQPEAPQVRPAAASRPTTLYPSPLYLNAERFSIDLISDPKTIGAEIAGLFEAHARHLFVVGESYQIIEEMALFNEARRKDGLRFLDAREVKDDAASVDATGHPSPPRSAVVEHITTGMKLRTDAASQRQPASSSSLKNAVGGVELLSLTRHALGASKLFAIVIVVVVATSGPQAEIDATILAVVEVKAE